MFPVVISENREKKLTKTENTRNIRHKSLEEFMFWLSPSSGCVSAGSLFRKSSRVKFLYNIKTIRNINPGHAGTDTAHTNLVEQ